jgi:predicted nucleotidyltransferase
MIDGPTDPTGALERFFSRGNHPDVASAYLFGSRSAARDHRESDFDVAVLLEWRSCPTRRDRFEKRVQLSSDLMSVLRTDAVDVLVLNDAPPTLAAKVVTAGRRVFCRDSGLDRAFFRDVQLRAADLRPFLRRTRRVKLAAINR